MHFVHKQDHITAALDLCQHIPETFFKFAPVFGPCHQTCHVETDKPLFFQLGRHVTGSHSLCQSLCDCSLPYPRLSHQRRIVFILSAQNTNDHVDLTISANYRFHSRYLQDHIFAELFQKLRTNRLLIASLYFSPSGMVNRITKKFPCIYIAKSKNIHCRRFLSSKQRQQHMNSLYLLAVLLSGLIPGAPQDPFCLSGESLWQWQSRCTYAIHKHCQGFCQLRFYTCPP